MKNNLDVLLEDIRRSRKERNDGGVDCDLQALDEFQKALELVKKFPLKHTPQKRRRWVWGLSQ